MHDALAYYDYELDRWFFKNPVPSFLDMSIDEEEERAIVKRWLEKQQKLAAQQERESVEAQKRQNCLAESISAVFMTVINGKNASKVKVPEATTKSFSGSKVPAVPKISTTDQESLTYPAKVVLATPASTPIQAPAPVPVPVPVPAPAPAASGVESFLFVDSLLLGIPSRPEWLDLGDTFSEVLDLTWLMETGEDTSSDEDSLDTNVLLAPVSISASLDIAEDVSSRLSSDVAYSSSPTGSPCEPTVVAAPNLKRQGDVYDRIQEIIDLISGIDPENQSLSSSDSQSLESAESSTPPPTPSLMVNDTFADTDALVASSANMSSITSARPDSSLLSHRWKPRGRAIYLTVHVMTRGHDTEKEDSVFPLVTYSAYSLAQLRKAISTQVGGPAELSGNIVFGDGGTAFVPLRSEAFYRHWIKERVRAGSVGEIECWRPPCEPER